MDRVLTLVFLLRFAPPSFPLFWAQKGKHISSLLHCSWSETPNLTAAKFLLCMQLQGLVSWSWKWRRETAFRISQWVFYHNYSSTRTTFANSLLNRFSNKLLVIAICFTQSKQSTSLFVKFTNLLLFLLFLYTIWLVFCIINIGTEAQSGSRPISNIL